MNNIDQKIQAALRREDADALGAEPNIAEEVLIAFRGRNRWLSILMGVINVALFVVAILAGERFYHATEITVQVQWGALAALMIGMMSFIKLWFWLEMHTNRVLREVKRVELLVVSRSKG